MADPISEERLEEIRAEFGPAGVYLSGVAGDGVCVMGNELLAEIERLNTVLHANMVVRNAAESQARIHKSVAAMLRDERNQERAEVKRLRAVIADEHSRLSHELDRDEELKRARAEADGMRDLLGSIWLYVGWRSATGRLTTEQRELWADAVDAKTRAGQIEDGEEPHPVAERWWRGDFVEAR